MPGFRLSVASLSAAASFLILSTAVHSQSNPFPGGTNPDGSLRPSPPLTRLFQIDAYTEYSILEPGTEQFRVMFMPEVTRVGATELVNETRGGSEGSDIEVYDPRTGQPLKFKYEQDPTDLTAHAIHAVLPFPVPQGGIGRVLIYKTYKDSRTYQTRGDDLVWVRGLSAQRFGVILPKGYTFVSSNIASQLSSTTNGRLKLALTNPSGGGSPITIHARKTAAVFAPSQVRDVVFDDIKTLYDLGSPESHTIRVEQIYSDARKGANVKIGALDYLKLKDTKVIDLDTAKSLPLRQESGGMLAKLDVPIANERQSAHLKLTGSLVDAGYKIEHDQLVFERALYGLRNSILLPAGWEVSAVSQPATLGIADGRAFVALVNLNAENNYKVTIRAARSNTITRQ